MISYERHRVFFSGFIWFHHALLVQKNVENKIAHGITEEKKRMQKCMANSMSVHMAIFFFSSVVTVSALYSKQTSPSQTQEANHKCTATVKGPPQMRKKPFDFQCTVFLKEIHRRETFAHTWQKHMRETHQEEYAGHKTRALFQKY